MADEIQNDIVVENTEVAVPESVADVVSADPVLAEVVNHKKPKFEKKSFSKNDRKPRREPRAKPEFDQKIIDIRRVTRVASGGRRFSFSVAIVAGNRKGMVGVATGKAGDTSLAIDKAYRAAKKNAVLLSLTKEMRIPHETKAKFKSATVHFSIAKGKGIVAGSSVRDVVELAGIRDVNAKLHSASKNKLNIAKASLKALLMLKKPRAQIEKAK
jgi:small subunit ribosomal protein S5